MEVNNILTSFNYRSGGLIQRPPQSMIKTLNTALIWAMKHMAIIRKSEWVSHHEPDLQIVTDDIWQAVQDLRRKTHKKRAKNTEKFDHFPVKLRCKLCGGYFTRHSHKYLMCQANKRYGTCTNNRKINLNELRQTIVSYLQAEPSNQFEGWIEQLKLDVETIKTSQKIINEQIQIKKSALNTLMSKLTSPLILAPSISEELTAMDEEIQELKEEHKSIIDLPASDQLSYDKYLNTINTNNASAMMNFVAKVTAEIDDEKGLIVSDLRPNFHRLPLH